MCLEVIDTFRPQGPIVESMLINRSCTKLWMMPLTISLARNTTGACACAGSTSVTISNTQTALRFMRPSRCVRVVATAPTWELNALRLDDLEADPTASFR